MAINNNQSKKKIPGQSGAQSGAQSRAGSADGVALLHKTFAVMELFTLEAPLWGQSEIAGHLDLPRSTVSRLVRFLTQRGYLLYSAPERKYALGPASFRMGQNAIGAVDLASISRDVIEQINRRTRETVVLMRYDAASSSMICVDALIGLHEGLQVSEKAGSIFPLYVGASAKCVLAALPEERRQKVLAGPIVPQGHSPSITSEGLAEQLDRIRARGYATAKSETYPGVDGIGFAILDASGAPVGSLAVGLPSYRMTEGARELIVDLLRQGTERIRRRLAGAVDTMTADFL